MALAYKTPGVYPEEIQKLPPIISAVETAIPAFIGYTEKTVGTTLKKPFRISSLVEYEAHFGGPQPETKITVLGSEPEKDGNGKVIGQKLSATLTEANRSPFQLYYALQLFFANGGGTCYIVPVGAYSTAANPILETDLIAGIKALEQEDEPTLLVFPEAQQLAFDKFKQVLETALAQCNLLKDRFTIVDVHGGTLSVSDPASSIVTIAANFRGLTQADLKYGAAYAPNLKTSLSFAIDETKVLVTYIKEDGTTVAAPVALNTLKAGNNLVYEGARAAIRGLPVILPPSSAMAGIYARVDAERGVWKAPANVAVAGVIEPTIEFPNRLQDVLNDDPVAGISINAIRSFTGRGVRVWGARTLAGNDAEWRYVNVRRLFILIEESCAKACADFVFEPNDGNTWVKLQAMIENFLTVLWRQGALQGAKPEHAFQVSVGLNKTMSADDILAGRLIVEVGVAAVRPAEFIVLRFSHKLAQS